MREKRERVTLIDARASKASLPHPLVAARRGGKARSMFRTARRQFDDVLIDPPRVNLAGRKVHVGKDVLQERDVRAHAFQSELAQRS